MWSQVKWSRKHVLKKSSGLQRGARSARSGRHCEVPGQRATVGLSDSDPGWGWLALRLASPWVTCGGRVSLRLEA